MKYALSWFALLALGFTGCSSYVNSPKVAAARAASEKSFSDPLIARAYNAKPAMRFPARIGLAPRGDSAVQQLRALDAVGKLDRFKALPQVAAIANVSTLVMSSGYDGDETKRKPMWNTTDVIVREAAAKLHTDAVLLIQLEQHVTDGQIFAPLSLFTLGMFPNDRAEIIVTALAALVDTRTGYVYGVLEKSAGKNSYSITWDDDSRARAIQKTERVAMEKLLAEFPDFWSGVVHAHRQ